MLADLIEQVTLCLIASDSDSDAVSAEASGTAHSVHVGGKISVLKAKPRNDRHVKVDDEVDLWDIDATC